LAAELGEDGAARPHPPIGAGALRGPLPACPCTALACVSAALAAR